MAQIFPTPNNVNSQPISRRVSDKFKKIKTTTNLENISIVNDYPVVRGREEDGSPENIISYAKRIRDHYNIKTPDETKHKGVLTPPHTQGVDYFTNTINRLSQFYIAPDNYNVPLPEPFGYRGFEEWKQGATLVERNFAGNATSFRFVIEFFETGNRYYSRRLRDDLNEADQNGNPYFTKHLIPTIMIQLNQLQNYQKAFWPLEAVWDVQVLDSLGSGSTIEANEIEVVQYIDALLKGEPVTRDNKLKSPYKKGTVISTHWFSQNPRGLGDDETASFLDVDLSGGTDAVDSAGDTGVSEPTGGGAGGSTRTVQADDGTNVNISGDTGNLTDQEVANISADLGFGPGTDETTTGTTFAVDTDGDGEIESILNLNDDPNFETVFDPFGNAIGNNDTFGAAAMLGNNLSNLQSDVQNYNNTQPLGVGGAQGNYAPFGTPGEFSYQTKYFQGTEYIWNRMNSGKWEPTFTASGFGGFGFSGGNLF